MLANDEEEEKLRRSGGLQEDLQFDGFVPHDDVA